MEGLEVFLVCDAGDEHFQIGLEGEPVCGEFLCGDGCEIVGKGDFEGKLHS